MYQIHLKLGQVVKTLRSWCLHHKKFHVINWKELCGELATIGQRVTHIISGNTYLSSVLATQPHLKKGYMYWKQRMKSQWTLLGDCPSHLLYSKIRKQKVRNDIVSLKDVHGNWATDPHSFINIVQEFWMSLLANASKNASEVETQQISRELNLPALNTKQQLNLSKPFN